MACELVNNSHQSTETNSTISSDIQILLVDDDDTTLTIVEAMLTKWGCRVKAVKNAFDALDILRKNRDLFDLVVSDLHMPFMDGFKLLKKIKEEFESIPVIIMSIDDSERVMSKSLEDGASFYLKKPVRLSDAMNLRQFAVSAKKRKNGSANEIGGNVISESSLSSKQNNIEILSDKRKDDSDASEQQLLVTPDETSQRLRKVWTPSLHRQFVDAIRQIGWENTVPKKIIETMKVPGLTRIQVASHLQKYRLCLKTLARTYGYTEGNENIFIRSIFASGLSPLLLLKPSNVGQHNIGMAPTIASKDQLQAFNNSISNPRQLQFGQSSNPPQAQIPRQNQLQTSNNTVSVPHLQQGQSSNANSEHQPEYGQSCNVSRDPLLPQNQLQDSNPTISVPQVHAQNQHSSAEGNQLGIGQSNNSNHQANLFLTGFRSSPLQTHGTNYNSAASCRGVCGGGLSDLMYSSNGLGPLTSKTLASPSLLGSANSNAVTTGPLNCSVTYENGNRSNSIENPILGSLGSAGEDWNSISNLSNNYYGVEMLNSGSGLNGMDGLMNETGNEHTGLEPMDHTNSDYTVQGRFDAAGGSESASHDVLPPLNQQEDNASLQTQAQQPFGPSRSAGGIERILSTSTLINDNSEEEQLDENELMEHFLDLETTVAPGYEQQTTGGSMDMIETSAPTAKFSNQEYLDVDMREPHIIPEADPKD